MKTITESFKSIVSKQRELNYNMPNLLRPPAKKNDITQIQNTIGLKLNKELIELYSCADGINVPLNTPGGLTGFLPIYNFLSLSAALAYYNQYIKFQDSFENQNTHYTPGNKLFPILEDGAGNCYWVDLNETENYGRIYWTNSWGDEPDYLFESLTNFMQVISECYDLNYIFVNDEGFLDEDVDGFYAVALKYNPKIEYWKK